MLTSSGPGQTHWGDSGSNNPAPAPNFADAQLKVFLLFLLLDVCSLLKLWLSLIDVCIIETYWFLKSISSIPLNYVFLQQELAAIFKKIGDKQTCTIGLYELYRITQLYPKVISIVSII